MNTGNDRIRIRHLPANDRFIIKVPMHKNHNGTSVTFMHKVP